MEKLSQNDTEIYIAQNYIGYDNIKEVQNRKCLVKWIRAAKDRWFYFFEDVFYKLHVMGFEVFYEDEKWVVNDVLVNSAELQKNDEIVLINGQKPELLEDYNIGEKLCIDILRNGGKKRLILSLPQCSYSLHESSELSCLTASETMPSIDLCSFTNIDKKLLFDLVKKNSHLRIDLSKNLGGNMNDMLEILSIISMQDVDIIVVDSQGQIHKKKVICKGVSKVRKIEFFVSDRTASSAEIFIAYLSKICKSIIIGEKTVGKFVVHQYIETELGVLAVPVYKVLVPSSIINGEIIEPYFRTEGFSPKDSYKEGDYKERLIE